MSLVEDMFKGNVGTGLAVAGVVLLGPSLLPAVGRILRPVVKTAIKSGMVVYRETLAGVGEVTGDLVAEARAELEQEHRENGGREPAAATARPGQRRSTPAAEGASS